MLCLPSERALIDPDPDETSRRALRLVSAWDPSVIGVAGWSTGGYEATRVAAQHPQLERLAIISTPFPEDTSHFGAVHAKTLLMFGSADPATGSSHGRRWQEALPDARLEMVPKGDHEILERVWKRVLSHLAPGRARRQA